ncbi:hypothetical protein [Acetobacter malorum]|uniref:Uncharacterized protein n=1 Tax=Acetobacter malorum TaxID=178901 RepID=A0A1Y3G722_9PROT|nr:hypothetical protein [Acetobacter malorum]OUJ06625.1 hypothetical protein HK23_14185 [Acetobacter malorum]
MSDDLKARIAETYGAAAEIARIIGVSREAVRQWTRVPKAHRKNVAAILSTFVAKKKAPENITTRTTVAWPGALIDKECARLKAHPCAPWADIIRLDKAIAIARHSGAAK